MVANLNTAVIYSKTLSAENVYTVLNYCGIFTTLAPGGQISNVYLTFFFAMSVNETSVTD